MEDARRARIEEKAEVLVRRETDFLEGVVLPPGLRERLVRLATATRNAKQNRSPFRHMLLHGPPGTGKTLCAQALAKATGLGVRADEWRRRRPARARGRDGAPRLVSVGADVDARRVGVY